MFYIQHHPTCILHNDSSTQVASESHQSSWKKADGHRERERCHEAIPQGRSHRQLLDEIFEEGNLLQGSTVSHPKGARFKQNDIIFQVSRLFRPVPLQPSVLRHQIPSFFTGFPKSDSCICPSLLLQSA